MLKISKKCLKKFFFPLAAGKIFDGLPISFLREKLIEYAVSVSCYTRWELLRQHGVLLSGNV
jgi:hypothetical protein